MTDKQVKDTKYQYVLNSNLVLQGQNRDDRSRRGQGADANLPSGEGESLARRQLAGFGDKVVKGKPMDERKMAEKSQNKEAQIHGVELGRKHKNETHTLKHVNLATMEVSQDLIYRPQTQETKGIYERIVHIVQRHLGDISIETIKDAVDEVLAVLKDDTQNDNQRKAAIDGLLGLEQLNAEEFSTMTVLASQLIDYEEAKDNLKENQSKPKDDQQIAIDLDEDEEEQSRQSNLGDVVEEEQSDEERVVEIDQEQEAQDDEQTQQILIGDQAGKNNKDDSKLTISDIDAHWLKRKLQQSIDDLIAEDIPGIENMILELLGDHELSTRDCEKKLFGVLTRKRVELVRCLIKSRFCIFYGIMLQQAQTPEDKTQVESLMKISQAGRQLLIELSLSQAQKNKGETGIQQKQDTAKVSRKQGLDEIINDKLVSDKTIQDKIRQPESQMKTLDFEQLKFQQGSRLMANKKCTLPKGSRRLQKPGYEEVYVPAVKQKKVEGEKLVPISSLPKWAQPAFPSYMTNLNRIQSKLFPAAFESPENLLVCAPTGAGKTNIAMLSCLQLLGEMRTERGYNLNQFKMIYIAPMKALVSEVVGNFQARLDSYGIKVRELTGDVHLSREQIEEANLIVTTPEKWDIITRKSGERAYVDLVKLIIIDEVHLLHDSRGPVLEAIIARTMRRIEETSELVRIVGLSATLPNYEDVAALLRVDPLHGLFYFDNSYRPVPLEQIHVGITEKKAIKRLMLMNEICYEKVMERVGKHQILVFTHSRKETARTAKIMRDMALAQDRLDEFVKAESESKKILLEVIVEKKLAVSTDLKELIPYGIGIHHAGLSKDDRTLVEDLFAAGHLKVLVSTATLAWGVNLPAHTVIIKGTQIYSPEQGKWVELSPQDILQMMGRAGRPQYDTLGEGIIITNHADLQYYLSLNNQQLPIESQMIQNIPDQLNAEIVLGTISDIKEAVNWLSYTYLYIRMRRNPDLYGVSSEDLNDDQTLIRTRMNLIHTSAIRLVKAGMIKYDKKSGNLLATAQGKVASHYYIKCDSMQVYNNELKPQMSYIDLFRLFALSKEFENIPIRENEKIELERFIDRVPIPIKGGIDETPTKINILLQAYIARFRLDGFDLNADMVYVTQSANRILRALFEMAIKKRWAQLSENLLNLCKMVEKQQWYSMTPLRQFTQQSRGDQRLDLNEICRRIERKEQFRWTDFFEFSAQRIGELIKFPKMGKVILDYVYKFPRLEISAFVQPITRITVRIELDIKTHEKFKWDRKYHGTAEPFWIIVHDGDSEQILHSELFILRAENVGVDHHLSFVVPLFDPLPPQYFIKVISDRWLQAEHVIPVSFKSLILPDKFTQPIELLDMQQKLISDIEFEEAEQIYKRIDKISELSPVQTQVFDKLYHSDKSLLICTPGCGSERRILAELAILREVQKEDFGKIVFISPKVSSCKQIFKNWDKRLGENGLGLVISMLQDDDFENVQNDLQQIVNSDVIVATSAKWDFISKKWRQRKPVLEVGLYIFDNIHLVSDVTDGSGALLEVVISRTRQIQSELKNQEESVNVRIVAMSHPIANAKDTSDWLNVSFPNDCFNFHPSIRASCPSLGPLQVNIQTFDQVSRPLRLLQMIKPTINQLRRQIAPGGTNKAIIFAPDRKQARAIVLEMINGCICGGEDEEIRFKGNLQSEPEFNFTDNIQNQAIEYGIVTIHDGQSDKEKDILKFLFQMGQVRVLVATRDMCWEIGDLKGDIVIIQEAQDWNSADRQYRDIPIADLLQMQSVAVNEDIAKCTILCQSSKKDYLAKFIQEPLPIESTLAHNLHDHLCSEIVSGSIQNIQEAVDWVTWSLLYRRIVKNPNYYEIAGKTGQHINDFLSELVEDTIQELQDSNFIDVADNELDLEAANLGRIAQFYAIKYQTLDTFAKNLLQQDQPQTFKIKDILDLLSQAEEYQSIVRELDSREQVLRVLALNLPFDLLKDRDFTDPSSVVNVLLQRHFSRKPIPVEYQNEFQSILRTSLRILHAMVDVISQGNNSHKSVLNCIDLCQMVVQGMWINQSPLLQLPYIDLDLADALKDEAQVEDVADFMNMDDNIREKLVKLDKEKMTELADACNRYPTMDLQITDMNKNNELTIADRDDMSLEITIRRDVDEADFDTKSEYLEELQVFSSKVIAPRFPHSKYEVWWIILSTYQNKILALKKVKDIEKKPNGITQNMMVPQHLIENEAFPLNIKVQLLCDSYLGSGIEKKIKINHQQ